jgi:hypothetical protein
MKLRNTRLTVGTQPKARKQRAENTAAKSAPNGSEPVSKVRPLLSSRWEITEPQPAPPTASSSAAGPTEPSEVSANSRLTHFELFTPEASAVFVAGSFNQWNPSATAMTRMSEGKWITDLSLPPGRYEYLFVVNGNCWMPDPKVRDYASNPFGGFNSVLEVATSA